MTVLTEPIDADDTPLDALLDRYVHRVAAAASGVDPSAVPDGVDLDETAIGAAVSGEADDLPLDVAVTILALEEGIDPGAELGAVRDHILLAMSSAVMDVDALARAVEADLEPGEIQAKVEGRLPMTLEEYAMLKHAISGAGR